MSAPIDIKPPVTHNQFSTVVDADRMYDKWIKVKGVTSGSHTVQIQGSDDGTNYDVITGSGVAGTMQLPTNGNITVDGDYEVPVNVAFLRTVKTDADDAAQVAIWLMARRDKDS